MNRSAGFTLLELLVVLTLMGLLAGLALPRLSQLYDSTLRTFHREEIRQQLEQLSIRALEERIEIVLNYSSEADDENRPTLPIELPKGWSLSTSAPIRFLPNGVCLGGEIDLAFAGYHEQWLLSPPLCAPVRQ